jgi:hypothetical protein
MSKIPIIYTYTAYNDSYIIYTYTAYNDSYIIYTYSL